MAITRAQQAKQMLQKGGRIGLRNGPAGGASAGGNYGGDSSGGYSDKERAENRSRGAPPGSDTVTVSPVQNKYGDETQKRLDTIRKDFINEPVTIKKVPLGFPGSGIINFGLGVLEKPLTAGQKITRKFNFDKVAKAGRYTYTDPVTGETYTFDQDLALTNPEIFEAASKQLLKDRAENIVDAYGNPITKTGDGPEELIIPLRDTSGIMNVADKPEEEEVFTPNLRLLAEGGMADIDREAFLLGGIAKGLKKAVRAVKKIVKSPIGKAALVAGIAGIPFGGGKFFGSGSLFGKGMGFLNTMKANKALQAAGSSDYFGGPTGIFDLLRSKPLLTIGGASALAGLYTAKTEDDEEELYAGADIDDPRKIIANPYNYLNIRNMAEGGSTEKEPVAKKTMPLLDMDGMEKDYREEGGFVPIGRMEKADDVPARLSKNEFVFTADAVRNAGDGDVDKGAEVMYNMMKNLESGGDVSEESQGLEGAREMFQTSKRLEEVL